MNIKPALYYTLVHRWSYGIGYSVFAVTSETGRRRINGRMLLSDGTFEPSHTTKLDCFGRFETEQAARDKIGAIVEIREKYKPLVDAAEKEARRIRNCETREIQEALHTSQVV